MRIGSKSPLVGIAFVELMVAIAVLSILMTIVFSLVTMATQRVLDEQALMSARYLAEHQLSMLRMDAEGGMPLENGTRQMEEIGLKPGRGMLDTTCWIAVRDVDEKRPGLKAVKVSVAWVQSGNREMEFELESLVAERKREE